MGGTGCFCFPFFPLFFHHIHLLKDDETTHHVLCFLRDLLCCFLEQCCWKYQRLCSTMRTGCAEAANQRKWKGDGGMERGMSHFLCRTLLFSTKTLLFSLADGCQVVGGKRFFFFFFTFFTFYPPPFNFMMELVCGGTGDIQLNPSLWKKIIIKNECSLMRHYCCSSTAARHSTAKLDIVSPPFTACW